MNGMKEGTLSHRSAYTDYGVRVQAVRNPVLRLVLYGLPWAIMIVMVIMVLSVRSFDDWMFLTGLLAAALALFTFQMLMQQIPVVFDVLWSRNIIARKQPDETDAAPTQAQTEAVPAVMEPSLLAKQYGDYLKGVENLLNHRGSLIFGLVIAGFGLARFPYEWGDLIDFLRSLPLQPAYYLWDIIFEVLIGFVLGLMAWRMFFVAVQISQLENRFDLMVKFDHPDGAGGLEPLGDLCLWNALILTIPGIFLGGWLVFWPRFPRYIDAVTGLFFYSNLFHVMLLVPIVLAPFTFILPLWSVHRLMVAKAVLLRRDLDQLGESINQLGRNLLSRAEDLDPEQARKMGDKLELMQQVYKANRNMPIWPLNTTVLIKFVTSQIVPLLGLTGLGEPVLKVVNAFAQFFGQ